MGSFANTLFTIMLGWLQGAASAIWSAFTTEEGGSLIKWIGNNWITLAVILCVAGLAVDLTVYLFRWRPLQVWKSFFRRRRNRNAEGTETAQEYAAEETAEDTPRRLFREEEREEEPKPVPRAVPEMRKEPAVPAGQTVQDDLARWETDEPTAEPEEEKAEKGHIITGAGYVVPEDSPYRRPAERREPDAASPAGPARIAEPDPFNDPEPVRGNRIMQSRKRRRISVSDLFSDPEEELAAIDAPQDLIDRNKAYHKPVYPTGWKKSEDNGE